MLASNPAQATATKTASVGPLTFQRGTDHDHIANGAAGEPCYMYGRALDLDGRPVSEAHIEVWQSDEDGYYDVQHRDLDHMQNRGQLNADAKGNYYFWAVKPVAYPIPHDGPVDDLPKAANRSPMRPAHVHFMVTAPGYQRLITHMFEQGAEYLDSDAVFGVKPSLITRFERREAGQAPDSRHIDKPFYVMSYDLTLVADLE